MKAEGEKPDFVGEDARVPAAEAKLLETAFSAKGVSVDLARFALIGEADVMIAGGAESMSLVPMGGNKPSFNPEVFPRDENVGIAYGMGLTAEKVAAQWKVSREAQDAFALESHLRALKAQAAGEFDAQTNGAGQGSGRLDTRGIETRSRALGVDLDPRRPRRLPEDVTHRRSSTQHDRETGRGGGRRE